MMEAVENGLSIICFVAVVIILNIYDYRLANTIVNPIFILSIPFSIIFIICCFNESINFLPFYYPSLWIWIFGLLLFRIGGVFVSLFCYHYRFNPFNTVVSVVNNKSLWIFFFIIVICVCLAIIKLQSVSGQVEVGSKELGGEIGSGGLIGRASNIILISIPVIIGCHMNNCVKYGIAIALMIYVVMLGTKTWMTYSIIASFIVIVSNKKLKLRNVVITVAFLALSFILYYRLNTEITDSSHFVNFVSRHLYFYITSGILPMGEMLNNPEDFTPNGVMLPFIRLIYYWIGDTVIFHSNNWVTTDLLLGTASNVSTFFGTLMFEGGTGEFIFYSIISGMTSYLSFILFLHYRGIFYTVAWGYTAAILFFGWYNWGFGSLRIWEIYAYCAIFQFITKYRYKYQIK